MWAINTTRPFNTVNTLANNVPRVPKEGSFDACYRALFVMKVTCCLKTWKLSIGARKKTPMRLLKDNLKANAIFYYSTIFKEKFEVYLFPLDAVHNVFRILLTATIFLIKKYTKLNYT